MTPGNKCEEKISHQKITPATTPITTTTPQPDTVVDNTNSSPKPRSRAAETPLTTTTNLMTSSMSAIKTETEKRASPPQKETIEMGRTTKPFVPAKVLMSQAGSGSSGRKEGGRASSSTVQKLIQTHNQAVAAVAGSGVAMPAAGFKQNVIIHNQSSAASSSTTKQ